MRSAPHPFALRLPRLIWLVVLALALQPLAWARQPAAQWVSLPYCTTGAASVQHASPAAQASVGGHAHHLRVLLNPAAALNAAGAQWAMPAAPGPTLAFASPPARRLLPQPSAPHYAAPRPSPLQPRAPPQVS